MTRTASKPDVVAKVPLIRRDRVLGWLLLLGIPGSLFTAAATVPMGLAALGALGVRLAGHRADADVARLFRIFCACYLAVLLTDLLNGGGIGNFQFTAVNYLPLLGAAGAAYVLRRSDVTDEAVALMLATAIWLAVAVSLFRALVLGVHRPGGLYMNPIPYAFVVSLWGMLLLSFALQARRLRPLLLATAVAATVPVLLAESKLVWLACCAGYAVVALYWGIETRNWRGLLLAVLAAALMVFVAYATIAHGRIASFVGEVVAFVTTGDRSGSSFGARAILVEAGFRAFLDGPLLGYGFAEHRDAAMAYVDPNSSNVAELTHLHNDFVTHFVAFGYVGAAFLIAFHATLVWIARNAADPARMAAAWAFVAMAAIYMSGEIFFNIEPVTGPAAIMIGLLMMRPRPPAPA